MKTHLIFFKNVFLEIQSIPLLWVWKGSFRILQQNFNLLILFEIFFISKWSSVGQVWMCFILVPASHEWSECVFEIVFNEYQCTENLSILGIMFLLLDSYSPNSFIHTSVDVKTAERASMRWLTWEIATSNDPMWKLAEATTNDVIQVFKSLMRDNLGIRTSCGLNVSSQKIHVKIKSSVKSSRTPEQWFVYKKSQRELLRIMLNTRTRRNKTMTGKEVKSVLIRQQWYLKTHCIYKYRYCSCMKKRIFLRR